MGVDQRAGATGRRPGYAAGVRCSAYCVHARQRRGVHPLQSPDPSVLRQIVVVQTNPRANNAAARCSRRVSNAQSRCDSSAIIMRRAFYQGNLQRLQRQVRGILQLGASGRLEKSKGGVVAQSVINGEMSGRAPGILRVKSQPLHILRKTPVARRHCGATYSRGRIRLCHTTRTEEKFGRIRCIEAGVMRISQYRSRGAGKCAAQYRLINKFYAEAWRVSSRRMAYVIAQLVFLLVAQQRKGGNGGRKLVVAKGVEARNGSKGRTERKLQ